MSRLFRRCVLRVVSRWSIQSVLLQGLSSPQHLETSTLATMYLEHKFGLRMASHSFHILRNFLHDNRLVLLLSIINEVRVDHSGECVMKPGRSTSTSMSSLATPRLLGCKTRWS